jgi:hypothetical protein
LLRRGLERQSWWPYFYALVDACCAVIVIVLLACTMVVGIQSFDFMAIQGHGTKVLPLDALFQSIQADPLAPQFWWIYALFLATMVPSLANLIIGGLSLTRGIPRLSMRIHGLMYDGKAMSDAERARIASLLAGQVVIGALLGVAGQAALAIIIFQYAMPFLGVELLDLAQVIAGLNIPLRLHDLLF